LPNLVAGALKRVTGAVSAVLRPWMQAQTLSPVYDSGRGWWTIHDFQSGAFQAAETPISPERVLANWSVYACLSLISADLGKMRLKLVELGEDGIWRETRSAAFSPVLKKPNRYQTRQKFIEAWAISKLGPAGNAYVLKERDGRGLVTGMHVLNPFMVTPLIAPDGSVFYRINENYLAKVTKDVEAVPAYEIIHDRAACLFHPLVGVSPIYACGLAAQQGLSIQSNQDQFFRNRSMPGGVITAPHEISETTAERIKREWGSRFSAENAGKTAVLGDGMKYEPFAANARDSQLAEQLSLTAKAVCSTYHVPPFKIGLEALPAGQKVEDMNRIYYADCLQSLMESIEALLDEGLGLELSGKSYGTEFEVDDLMRMDSATMIDALGKAVGAAILAPDEARFKMNLPPVEGGASPYLQQQNYSLAALAKRDAQEDPFGSKASAPAPESNPDDDAEEFAAEMKAQVLQLPSLVRRAA
jgi:HK97 family phage portal protein